MNVSVVGLGSMGDPVARNLIRAGHSVTVYNRTATRAEPFRALGAEIAASPERAARNAEAVITLLADDHAVEAVVLDGLIGALPADGVHISMSTISVGLSRRLAAAHRAQGQHFLAAPVFGRPDAAAAAKLFVVAGGASEQIERCRPLFDAIGQKTFVAGEEPESANAVKLSGNFLITAMIESLAEAFTFVRKSGIDATAFLDILTGSLFNVPIYRNYGAMIVTEKFEPAGFKLPLGLKDNRLLLAAAEAVGVPMPVASLVRDRMLAAMAQGLGEADWAVIARIASRDAGL